MCVRVCVCACMCVILTSRHGCCKLELMLSWLPSQKSPHDWTYQQPGAEGELLREPQSFPEDICRQCLMGRERHFLECCRHGAALVTQLPPTPLRRALIKCIGHIHTHKRSESGLKEASWKNKGVNRSERDKKGVKGWILRGPCRGPGREVSLKEVRMKTSFRLTWSVCLGFEESDARQLIVCIFKTQYNLEKGFQAISVPIPGTQ